MKIAALLVVAAAVTAPSGSGAIGDGRQPDQNPIKNQSKPDQEKGQA